MITFTFSDSAAIKSAFNRDGGTGAHTEIKRRWPQLTDDEARVVLERLMAMPSGQRVQPSQICRDRTK
ncbi:MAG: hypothetical protein WCJ64_27445, partial [Rhodospirillaceae bacterium]